MEHKKIIRLSKCSIDDSDIKSVEMALRSEYLGMGNYVKNFEDELENYLELENGAKAICVSSGTAALHLALQCSGIRPGDEILVPSLTYVATWQAISAVGAEPVACDVEESTLLLDLVDAEKKLTKKTKAIISVHYGGDPGNVDDLISFTKKTGIKLIEDAAQSFGSKLSGKKIGSHGTTCCFSFDGIKNITSGEGGCLVVSENNVAERIMDARLLGVKKDSAMRYLKQRSWDFDVEFQGWRYHMSNLMAALGSSQLLRVEEFKKRRQQLSKAYDSLFIAESRIICFRRNYDEISPHLYVVRIPGLTIEGRNKLRSMLLLSGVETGVHWKPCHYLKFFRNQKIDLTITDKLYPELVTLPLHVDMSISDVEYVVTSLKTILDSSF